VIERKTQCLQLGPKADLSKASPVVRFDGGQRRRDGLLPFAVGLVSIQAAQIMAYSIDRAKTKRGCGDDEPKLVAGTCAVQTA
jgi:hypothetical protein